MSGISNKRMTVWTQPERPEWVRKFNLEAAYHNMGSVIPLDEASLIAEAVKNTGMSYFGDDPWEEPFRILIKSLHEEANLSPFGRLMTRSDLLMYLEGRLRIEDKYKRHPEIESETIKKPFFIIGQGRCGSTYLQKLMSLPPENRTHTDIDGMFPVAFQENGKDTRWQVAQNRMRQWNEVVPQVEALHHFGADAPCDNIRLEAFSFRSLEWLNMLGNVPSYNAYIVNQPRAVALRYCKKILKLLQWQKPGYQWVLKNPVLTYLPETLEVFPDLRFVWSHRDPIKAVSSIVSMIGTNTFVRSDRKLDTSYEWVTNPSLISQTLSAAVDLFQRGQLPQERLCNVLYTDLTSNPMATIEKIYTFFDKPLSQKGRQSIDTYISENPRSSRPAHVYSHGEEAQIRAERIVFKKYQDYFSVPNEF